MTLRRTLLMMALFGLGLSACGEESSAPGVNQEQDSADAGLEPTPDVNDAQSTTDAVVEPECTQAAGDTNCDDGDACTADLCVDGVCTHELRQDACFVGGECVENGANPGEDACLVCDVSVTTDALQAVSCDDGNPCTVDACDPGVGCDFNEPNNDGTCDDGQACSSDDRCEDGECLGTCVCEVDSDCEGVVEAGSCERAQCVDYACAVTSDPNKNGAACGEELCLTAGQCEEGLCVGQEDKDCSSAGDGACNLGVCNAETGDCEASVEVDGASCSDSDGCTQNDQCVSGVCVGTQQDCSDLDGICTVGACKQGSCVGEIQLGESCDSGSECVFDATCDATGNCLGDWDSASCPCQEDSDCDDGLSCTADSCHGDSATCVFSPIAGSCSIAGACYAAQESHPDNACVICDPEQSISGWSALACDDGNPCTQDICTDGVCGAEDDDSLSCDDGDPCSLDDQCAAGACVGTCECEVDLDCEAVAVEEAPNGCQMKTCVDFQCVVVTDASKEGVACDDGLACTTGEVCGDGSCAGGDEVVCDDLGAPCASNACLEEEGGCTAVTAEAGATCDDSDPCTDKDVCSVEGECAGLLKDCSGFADPCNAAQCDSGSCVKVPESFEGLECSDGQECTVNDTCAAGSCVASWDGDNAACDCNGDDLFCDDGLACTVNTCAADGSCETTLSPGFCKVGGACFSEGALNPENPCELCDSTSASSWTAQSGGTPCTANGNSCAPGTCNDSGVCVATTLEDFATCDDANVNTHADWCYSGACDGFTRSSQADDGGDTEYTKASTDSDDGAHALFVSNSCTDADGCGVELERYADAGTLDKSWTVGGTLSQFSWAITEDTVVSGSIFREYVSDSDVWSLGDEATSLSDAATAWNATNDQTIKDVQTLTDLQFSALERLANGKIYGFGVGPVTVIDDGDETTTLQSVVRACWQEAFSIPFSGTVLYWWCQDQPVRALGWTSGSSSTAVHYKDCAGFAEVAGTLFLGCNWHDDLTMENIQDATDEGVEDRDIVAYNPALEEWRYRAWASGDGQALNGFTGTDNQLVAVGLKGTLLVSTVTGGVPSELTQVSIADFSHQEVTDLHAITVHEGRVWAVGSYVVDDVAGGTQHLILVHGDAAADLSHGEHWTVKTIHTQPGACGDDPSNPAPCGVLGADFTFKAVVGSADGLYIFGSWFDATVGETGQRNRTAWRWPMP